MNASDLLNTIEALHDRLTRKCADVYVHEGDMPFGVRGVKKRIKGCYLSRDKEGLLCIVIEAEKQKGDAQ